MRRKFVYVLMTLTLLITSVYAAYAFGINATSDPDRQIAITSAQAESPRTALRVTDSWMPLAKAWFTGPPDRFGAPIDFHLTNLQPGRIRFASLSFILCEDWDTGERLIIDGDGVFNIVPPDGGTVNVYSPDGINEAPVVTVEFTSFDEGETASFDLDPDTFADPNRGTYIGELVGLKIQVWLEDGFTAGWGSFTVNWAGDVGTWVVSV